MLISNSVKLVFWMYSDSCSMRPPQGDAVFKNQAMSLSYSSTCSNRSAIGAM